MIYKYANAAINYSRFWKLASSAKNELQNESNSMTWIWNWDDSNWVCSCYRSKLTDISNDTWNFVPNSWIFVIFTRYKLCFSSFGNASSPKNIHTLSYLYLLVSNLLVIEFMILAKTLLATPDSIRTTCNTSDFISDKIWNFNPLGEYST